MKYLVKTTYKATAKHPSEKEGTTKVWYTGKGGYVYDSMEYAEGWNCERWAKKIIKDDKAFHDCRPKYSDAWDITWEIVSYGK